MTGIAGILGPTGSDVTSRLSVILDSMKDRGSNPRTMVVDGNDRVIAIGLCSHENEPSRMISPEEGSMVADGIVPASLELEDVGGETDGRSLSDAVRTSRPFANLAISAGKLLALRDTVGQKPLYFGTGPGGTVAVASLKTPLARIGIQHPQPVPPGKLVSLGNAE
ncbi:hypothetical protein J2P12_02330, partial [Candidatus Bathyarchaeota archaeon]|nr:hypothetical protein [Candidatus Bathyarchaeota archaeon]